MPDDPVPVNLPTFKDWISSWLGFQLPAIHLPQTAKNLDKALGRLIEAGGANIASRWERDTSNRDARKNAEAHIIGTSGNYVAGQINNQSSLSDRALTFSFGDTVLKQANRETIAKLAIEDLRSKSTGDSSDAAAELDDDWLNTFSDLSSLKSNSDIQALWARILAGKIRQPSSFSLQSLHLLSNLDTSDAVLIHSILGYVISRSFIYKSPSWKDIGRFITCEDLGVISGTSGLLSRGIDLTASMPQPPPSVPPLLLLPPFQLSGVLLIARTPPRLIQIPCFNLTRFGIELLSLSDGFQRDEAYEQDFIAFLKSNGATVQRAVTATAAGGQGVPIEDV